MDHAITVADVVYPALVLGGIFGVGVVMVWLVWLFNPFRNGDR